MNSAPHLDLKNSNPNVSIRKYCINISAAFAIMSSLAKPNAICQYEHLGKSMARGKPLRYRNKDATAIRKHCHSLGHLGSIDNFSILGNAMNNYHLSLKETLMIFKLKPSLNASKESIPLYLFDNGSEHC